MSRRNISICVICIAEKTRPSPAQVEAMYEQNKDGVGIAWREKNQVKWVKGLLSLEEAQTLCSETPLPYVVHFRIQTVGGKRAALCHPFPVEQDVPLDLNGTTNGYVLFHNGHWSDWRKCTLESLFGAKSKIELPKGKWSDSRAMAFAAALFGVNILDFIDEKSVAFGPKTLGAQSCFISGSGWQDKNGLWFSNLNWEGRVYMIEKRMNGKSEAAEWMGTRRPPYSPLVLPGYSENDDILPMVNPQHQPHGHKYYADKMCVFHSCIEPRIDKERYCKLHLPLVSQPGKTVKEVEKVHDEAGVQDIVADLYCIHDGCENKVAGVGKSHSYCVNHMFKSIKCIHFGCTNNIDAKASINYCTEHLTPGGGTIEPTPFSLLKDQFERKEISLKQLKKAVKKLNKSLKKEGKRAKMRWRLPAR